MSNNQLHSTTSGESYKVKGTAVTFLPFNSIFFLQDYSPWNCLKDRKNLRNLSNKLFDLEVWTN